MTPWIILTHELRNPVSGDIASHVYCWLRIWAKAGRSLPSPRQSIIDHSTASHASKPATGAQYSTSGGCTQHKQRYLHPGSTLCVGHGTWVRWPLVQQHARPLAKKCRMQERRTVVPDTSIGSSFCQQPSCWTIKLEGICFENERSSSEYPPVSHQCLLHHHGG